MARSQKVASEYINRVKLALKRNGFPSQQALANRLGLSRSTIKHFLNGTPVDRLNFEEICETLGLDWQEIVAIDVSGIEDFDVKPKPVSAPRQDWGEAPDVPVFFGRTQELATLEQWIVTEKCRLVAIAGMRGIGKTTLSLKLGMGGIGKTDLSVKLARGIQDNFEFVIWRKLLNAPPITTILADLIKFLSCQQEFDLPDTVDGGISRLLHYLREHRCLLILDNVETILQGGSGAGNYRPGYEGYGQLFRRVGEVPHQSCLLLTTREKPRDIRRVPGKTPAIRCLELGGLEAGEGRKLFAEIGQFAGAEADWQELSDFYNGNPLALELAANHISEVFGGNISEFLREGKPVFSDLRELLDWHFQRLSGEERQIMYWLAIHREAVSIAELKADILSAEAKEAIPETLQSLQRRLPLERSPQGFTLQPVLIEYVTQRLIEGVRDEVKTGTFALFNSYALMQATAKDYVRETQVRLIVQPVAEGLMDEERMLKATLERLREQEGQYPGYAAGNILNMLCCLKIDLSGYDFSHLTIRQAYLQDATLHDVNFAHSNLAQSTFRETVGLIFSVAFSPDGKLLAAGDTNCEIHLWQIPDYLPFLILKGHTDWVRSIAFSPDGSTLASGGVDRSVRLWDLRTGQCYKILQGHDRQIWSITFSQDGSTFASCSSDCTIKLWDAITGQCWQTLQGHSYAVMSIAFSPDGCTLVSGSPDGSLKLWNVHAGKCLKTLQEDTPEIVSVTFSPDGCTLVSSGSDQKVKLWDICTGQCLKTLQENLGRVLSVAFSPDGFILASCGEDQTVKLWDVCTGQRLKIFQGHSRRVWSISFSPDGATLVSSGEDSSVRLWDVNTGQCLKTLQGYNNLIWSVAFSPDGKTVASGSDQKMVNLWNICTGKCLKTFQGHANRVLFVAFSPDGMTLASGSEDRTVRLWDIQTGRCLKTIEVFTHRTSIAFSPDGNTFACGRDDFTMNLWDVFTGQSYQNFQGHTGWIRAVAFSPDGQTLVSGSDDGTAKLWDVSTGRCLKTLLGHNSWIRSVAFNRDGQTIVSGNNDSTIKLWNASEGQCIRTFRGHSGTVSSVAFSPDGDTVISGGKDGNLKLWEVSTGQCLKTFQGHSNHVRSVVFSSDGITLASGGEDETIKLWNVKTGECLNTIKIARPYEGTNIAGVSGLEAGTIEKLKVLGAVDFGSN